MTKRTDKVDAARAHFDKLVKCLPLENNSMILIKANTQLSKSQRVLSQIADAIARAGYTGCMLAVVNDFGDLSVLNEKRARQVGWQRVKPNILRRILGVK